MQLLIKQRVFSWSDTYDIYDEQGNQKTTDVTKYCVYVDPVYETVENKDGTKSQKLVKDGYYGWVYQTEIILLSSDF